MSGYIICDDLLVESEVNKEKINEIFEKRPVSEFDGKSISGTLGTFNINEPITFNRTLLRAIRWVGGMWDDTSMSMEEALKIKIGNYEIKNRPSCICCCMNEIHRPKHKESCYFYDEVRDMGGAISTCNYFNELGYCPCDKCGKFIDTGEIYGIVKKIVDERIPE